MTEQYGITDKTRAWNKVSFTKLPIVHFLHLSQPIACFGFLSIKTKSYIFPTTRALVKGPQGHLAT